MAPRRIVLAVMATVGAVGVSLLAPATASTAPVAFERDGDHGVHGSVDVTLDPGTSARVISGQVPRRQKSVVLDLAVNGDDALFKDLVFSLAPLSPSKRFLFCFYASQLNEVAYDESWVSHMDFDETQTTAALVNFVACQRISYLIADVLAQQATRTDRSAPRRSCPTNPTGVPARTTRTPDGFAMSVDGDLRKSTKSPLKVTCQVVRGKVRLTLQPKSKKKSLRSVLGKNISFGITSPSTAEGSVTLKVTFRSPR